MSGHWRLAVRGAAAMVVLAVPVAAALLYFYGMAHAGAFLYGVGTGIVSFASTALTVPCATSTPNRAARQSLASRLDSR